MTLQHRYFDRRTGRELSRAEAMENGCLKDGVSLRVSSARQGCCALLLGSAPRRFVVRRSAARRWHARQRPGYRVFDDDSGRQAIAHARAAYIFDLENAWRTPVARCQEERRPAQVTGRSRCPECDGSGVVHGKTCQGCGGDGWVDDDDEQRGRRRQQRGLRPPHRRSDRSRPFCGDGTSLCSTKSGNFGRLA